MGNRVAGRTVDSKTPVLGWIPIFLFSTCTRNDDVASVLCERVKFYLYVRAKG